METLFSLGALPKIHLFDKPVDKQAVKEFLEGRIKELADKFGFVYNKVTIRNQKTRWGSCSGKNNINLNMKLMNITNHLICRLYTFPSPRDLSNAGTPSSA